MQNRKLANKFGCFLLATSLVISGMNIPMTSQAKTTAKYYNKTKTITFKDSKGIKKCLVNGKKKKIKAGAKKVKITFKKEGKYTVKITNRKKKVTTKIIYIDKTAPTITGVKDGGNYSSAVTIAAKDKYGMSSFKVNGKKIKSPYKTTISETGAYELLAEDKAGNIKKITFNINSAQPSTASGDAVSSSAVTASGSSTNAEIPNAPAGPLLPGIDTTGNQDKTPTVGCDHIWILQAVEEEATCYSTGLAKYACNSCGGTKREELPKLDHDYSKLATDERYEVKKATCTEAGEYYYCCKYCGKATTKTGAVSSTGHKFSKKVASTEYLKEAATLEHGDIYYLACVSCGEKGIDTWDNERKLDHTTHTFSDTSIADETNLATAATCTKPATYYYKCAECNTFDTENTFSAGEALGHDFSEKTLKEEATCQHGNIYACKCSRCTTYAPETTDDGMKLDHVYVENPIKENLKDSATCTKQAIYYRSCKMCGEKALSDTFSYGELAEHKYIKSNTKVAKEKSCTEPRMYYFTCELCGEQGLETYESSNKSEQATGHDFAKIGHDDYLMEAATCQHGTKYYYACRNCNEVDKTQIWDSGDKLEHDYQETADPQYMHLFEAATCLTPAKYYKVCTMCHNPSNSKDCIFSSGEALGHDYSQQETVQAATPISDRTYQRKCSRCGQNEGVTLTEVGSHTDHAGPEISWKFTTSDGAYFGNLEQFYTTDNITTGNAFGLSYTTKGTLEISVKDNGSGIQSIKTYTWIGDQEYSYENSLNTLKSTTGWNTVGTYAVYTPNVGPISILNIEANFPSKYVYEFIRVTDWAGNTTTVRTANLILK